MFYGPMNWTPVVKFCLKYVRILSCKAPIPFVVCKCNWNLRILCLQIKMSVIFEKSLLVAFHLMLDFECNITFRESYHVVWIVIIFINNFEISTWSLHVTNLCSKLVFLISVHTFCLSYSNRNRWKRYP
jgi:hypothetical protein